MGTYEILRHYFLEHERPMVLNEAYGGVKGDHYAGKETMCKLLQEGLWWPTMHAHASDYCHRCDICQIFGKPSRQDDMSQVTLEEFDNGWLNLYVPLNY